MPVVAKSVYASLTSSGRRVGVRTNDPAQTEEMMIGRKFERLTVIGSAPSVGTKRRWHCRCDCGGETTAFQWSLLAGRSRSCGCLKSEQLNKRQNHELHGMHRTPEYSTWKQMKSKCYNVNHAEYAKFGGKGASVCDDWRQSFAAFLRDMGARPSLGYTLVRIDDEKPFCAANCRWMKTRSRVPRSQRHGEMRELGVLASEES